jgi:hypothetical protein
VPIAWSVAEQVRPAGFVDDAGAFLESFTKYVAAIVARVAAGKNVAVIGDPLGPEAG